MQQGSTSKLRSEFRELIVWCVATPVLAIWPIISLLPLVSAISAWGDPLAVLIALGFFGTGAASLIIGYGCYRFLLRTDVQPSIPTNEARLKRVAMLTAYALIWLLLYDFTAPSSGAGPGPASGNRRHDSVTQVYQRRQGSTKHRFVAAGTLRSTTP